MTGKLLSSVIALLALSASACTERRTVPSERLLRLPAPGGIETLDPAVARNELDIAESSRAYEAVSALAERGPLVSDNGRTWTIHLKKGILFHDDPCFAATSGVGRELVAGDVVYSLLRLADPRVSSPAWSMLEGKVEGLDQWRESPDYSVKVEGLAAVDRYTVRVRLTSPFNQFPKFLAGAHAAVVAREAVEHYGADFGVQAVGTGPYRLQAMDPAEELVWKKNPTFRSLQPDRVERVIVRVFNHAEAQWRSFLARELDVAEVPPTVTHFTDLEKKGVRIIEMKSPAFFRDVFNVEHPLFSKNRNLRLALSTAVEGEAGVSRARELLIKAGYPEGKGLPVIRYEALNQPATRIRGTQLQEAFGNIGVRLKTIFHESEADLQAAIDARQGHLWGSIWHPDGDEAVAADSGGPGEVLSIKQPLPQRKLALWPAAAEARVEDFGLFRLDVNLSR